MLLQPVEHLARVYVHKGMQPYRRVDDVRGGAAEAREPTSNVPPDERQLFVERVCKLRNSIVHRGNATQGRRVHEVAGSHRKRSPECPTPWVIAFRLFEVCRHVRDSTERDRETSERSSNEVEP